MEKLGVLILAENAALRAAIKDAIASSDNIEIQECLESAKQLEDATWRLVPDVIIASLDSDPAQIFETIGALGDRCPNIVLCGPADHSDLIIRSMRLGVREYIPLPPDPEELRRVVDRLSAARNPGMQGKSGPIVGVIGAKGGVGATVLSCQLGFALQAKGAQTTIVDLNLQSGDVALYHDLSPTFGVADLDRESGDIDRIYLQSLIEAHSSGVGLMSAPLHANSAPLLRPSRLQHGLTLIQSFSQVVIVDLPRECGDLALAAIEFADQIIVVTTLDIPSLAHCKLQLRMLEQAGIPRGATLVVSNNSEPRTSLAEKDIREFLGRPVDMRIPRDPATVLEAVNTGTSLSAIGARSEIVLAIDNLAREVGKRCGLKDRSIASPKRGISRVKNMILGGRYGAP